MSATLNNFQPLPPMPKINLLSSGNIISKSFDSFPPIKTPKLQELNKERISYPDLKTITTKEIKPILPLKKTKKKKSTKRLSIRKIILKQIKKLQCKTLACSNKLKYTAFILIKSVILCSVIYFILSSLIKKIKNI